MMMELTLGMSMPFSMMLVASSTSPVPAVKSSTLCSTSSTYNATGHTNANSESNDEDRSKDDIINLNSSTIDRNNHQASPPASIAMSIGESVDSSGSGCSISR